MTMTVKQICSVLYDNQRVEIYSGRRSYEPVAWGTANQFRYSSGSKYADAEVDVVVPTNRTVLIYI